MRTGHTWLRLAGAVALTAALGASAAQAAEEDVAAEAVEEGSNATRDWGCTWLPDLRCGRSGRPEGWRMPIVQPYLFEDPFITTGVYPYYVFHEYPEASIFQGGQTHVAAVQARIAITDRLAFIATKDGYRWNDPDLRLLDDEEGWMNIAGGFKYLLIRDDRYDFYLTPAIRYEAPSGAHDVNQGEGDGIIIPSVSAGWSPLESLHLIAGVGGQIPIDQDFQSSSVFYHVYADYEVHPRFTPFVQISGTSWTGDGDGTFPIALKGNVDVPLSLAQAVVGTGPFDGADVVNLGSEDVSGKDLVTAAVGAHFKLTDYLVWSLAYERAISNHKGVFQQRVTTALSVEF
jgi:hypothetical protein